MQRRMYWSWQVHATAKTNWHMWHTQCTVQSPSCTPSWQKPTKYAETDFGRSFDALCGWYTCVRRYTHIGPLPNISTWDTKRPTLEHTSSTYLQHIQRRVDLLLVKFGIRSFSWFGPRFELKFNVCSKYSGRLHIFKIFRIGNGGVLVIRKILTYSFASILNLPFKCLEMYKTT